MVPLPLLFPGARETLRLNLYDYYTFKLLPLFTSSKMTTSDITLKAEVISMENEKNKNREFNPDYEANPEFEVDPEYIEWICQRVMNENDQD